MRTLRITFIAGTIAILLLSYMLGAYIGANRTNDFSHYYGVWEGSGVVSLPNSSLSSHLKLIIDESQSRVSLTNILSESSFTVDATMVRLERAHQDLYLDFDNLKTNGLEAFTEQTGISIPPSPALIRLQIWRLNDEQLFIHFSGKQGVSTFHKIQKKHALSDRAVSLF